MQVPMTLTENFVNEETERYTVFVKVLEKNTEKEKNVYLTTQDHLNVPMKWSSDKTILINGITLDVEKDILDERQRCTNEADRQSLDWKIIPGEIAEAYAVYYYVRSVYQIIVEQ